MSRRRSDTTLRCRSCLRQTPLARVSTFSAPTSWSTTTCHGTQTGWSSGSVASTASARPRSATCGTSLRKRPAKAMCITSSWRSWSSRARRWGGQVFDVLGKLQFEGRPLRELLIEAIRYGEQPEVRARLTWAVENAVDRSQLQDLLEERGLAHETMDVTRVQRIGEEMQRADARRLQPHYIESFFMEAFRQLGGTVKQREARRYEITHVPAPVRNRDRLIGFGEPVQPRYERVAFEKDLVAPA